MKHKILIGIIFVLVLLLIFSGCGGGKTDNVGNATPTPTMTPTPTLTPLVYTAGFYYNSNSHQYVPCYWRETTRTDLSPTGSNGAQAKSIFISDDTVYVGGYHDSSGFVGCYWPGTTVATDLTETNGWVNSIFVSAGMVYTAGRYGNSSLPCYWTDGVRSAAFELPVGASSGFVSSVFVDGNTVYSGGFANDGMLGTAKPCYWEGTTLRALPMPAEAVYAVVNSIYVSGMTVYTAGYIRKGAPGWETLPCYWVGQSDPVMLKINDSTQGEAAGIQAVNGKIYIAGWYAAASVYPCFWVFPNTNEDLPTVLSVPAGSNGSETTSIYVLGNTVYVAGWYQMNSGSQEFPCYWNGNTGELTQLPTDPAVTSQAKANAIFVK